MLLWGKFGSRAHSRISLTEKCGSLSLRPGVVACKVAAEPFLTSTVVQLSEFYRTSKPLTLRKPKIIDNELDDGATELFQDL